MDRLQVCKSGLYSPEVAKYPASFENWKLDQKVNEEIMLLEKFTKSDGGNNTRVNGIVKIIVVINAGNILLARLS